MKWAAMPAWRQCQVVLGVAAALDAGVLTCVVFNSGSMDPVPSGDDRFFLSPRFMVAVPTVKPDQVLALSGM
jgi:hypothetical protein